MTRGTVCSSVSDAVEAKWLSCARLCASAQTSKQVWRNVKNSLLFPFDAECKGPSMNEPDWISRCADRLQLQWPRADRQELEKTARDLLEQEHWRNHAAEEAAVMWLSLGVRVPE